MIDINVVKFKLNNINHNLQRLHEKKGISLEEFKNNFDLQDVVLHNLQLAIQGCIDIASHIVSDNAWKLPGTVASLFDVLAENKIIDAKTANTMRAMTDFRNFIVHEYDTIDIKRVFEIITQRLDDFEEYLSQILVYAKL